MTTGAFLLCELLELTKSCLHDGQELLKQQANTHPFPPIRFCFCILSFVCLFCCYYFDTESHYAAQVRV